MLQMIPQISALICIAYIFQCKYGGVLNLYVLFLYVVIIIIMLHCAFIMKYCFVISVVVVVITGCFMMSQSS